CHLWQHDHGKPPRRCYHNKEWANKMISVGLMPSHNGQVGGKIVGQHMNDYTIEGGLFETKFNQIQKQGRKLKLPYHPVHYPDFSRVRINGIAGAIADIVQSMKREDAEPTKSGVKFKYTCPCGNNVWGKSGLKLQCLDCNGEFAINER